MSSAVIPAKRKSRPASVESDAGSENGSGHIDDTGDAGDATDGEWLPKTRKMASSYSKRP